MTPFRAIQAEVHQKMNDEETKVQWAVELKQLLANSKAEAKKEFESFSKEYSHMDNESTTCPSSRRTRRKSQRDPSDASEESSPRPGHPRKRGNRDASSDGMEPKPFKGSKRDARLVSMTNCLRCGGVWV